MTPRRILIVPDKFKGTLTAHEAAAAIAAGWAEVRPEDSTELLPMADGGEGFGRIIGQLVGAECRHTATVDALGRPRTAEWWFEPNTRCAIVEAATVNGLALLQPARPHPFDLDTFGLGAVLRDAEGAGARDAYVGLGGSATNDGGFGLARALGWTFLDRNGAELSAWSKLRSLARIDPPTRPLSFETLTIAVDVDSPLLGDSGATQIYGYQKGLKDPADIAHAEACLTHLAHVVAEYTRQDQSQEAGAGAAGGLGFGLRVFAAGKFQSGGQLFAKLAHLDKRIQTADLVITAEGKLDAQTLSGKGPGLVASAAARAGKPCLCLAGSLAVDVRSVPWGGFRAWGIVPDVATFAESMREPNQCLQRLAAAVARRWAPVGLVGQTRS